MDYQSTDHSESEVEILRKEVEELKRQIAYLENADIERANNLERLQCREFVCHLTADKFMLVSRDKITGFKQCYDRTKLTEI